MFMAHSANCSYGASLGVGYTVIWRFVHVYEIFFRRLVVSFVFSDQLDTASVKLDFRCSVVAVSEPVADLPEGRQLLPAGLQSA